MQATCHDVLRDKEASLALGKLHRQPSLIGCWNILVTKLSMQHKDPLLGNQNQPAHPNRFDECVVLLLLDHGTCGIYRGSPFLVQLILTPKQKQHESMILLLLRCHHLEESPIWMLHFQLLLILLDPTCQLHRIVKRFF